MVEEQAGITETVTPESQPASREELEARAKEAIAKLTPQEIRKLRGAYFTVRRAQVAICEHRYNPGDFPRHRNCESCWFAFYNEHGELVKQMDEVYQEYGKAALDNLVGKKPATMFLRFMSTVAKMTKEMTPVPPQTGECNDGYEHEHPERLTSGTDEAGQVPAVVSGTSGTEQEVQNNSLAG